MSLADKLVSSFLAFELDINVQSPVHNIRTEAIKEFEKTIGINKTLIHRGNQQKINRQLEIVIQNIEQTVFNSQIR